MKTNLITKNVILRFKDGRKIIFAEKGIKTYRGNKVLLGPSGKNYIVWNPKIKAYDANLLVTEKDLDTKVGKGNVNGKVYKGSDNKWYQNGKRMINLYSSKSTSKFTLKPKKSKVSSNTPKLDPNRYVSIFDDGTWIANVLKEGLTNRDLVKAFQLKLIDAGLLEKNGADGIWGKNTEAAYQAMLAKNKETTPILTLLPIQLYIPSANTLGYRTNFDYTGSNSNIRDLGFNDYSGMVNFINNNPDNLFSKDMVQRFGNTNGWNLNEVESALNVSGKYRPGRGGNFSDIMKSQAAWAGTQNGTYDRNLNFWNNLKVINGKLFFKQGGLISKNPVKRFKTKIK